MHEKSEEEELEYMMIWNLSLRRQQQQPSAQGNMYIYLQLNEMYYQELFPYFHRSFHSTSNIHEKISLGGEW